MIKKAVVLVLCTSKQCKIVNCTQATGHQCWGLTANPTIVRLGHAPTAVFYGLLNNYEVYEACMVLNHNM